jgi:hypothetical protein
MLVEAAAFWQAPGFSILDFGFSIESKIGNLKSKMSYGPANLTDGFPM